MSDQCIHPYWLSVIRQKEAEAEEADFWKRLSLLESSQNHVMRERLVKDKWRYRHAINALVKLAEDKGFGEEAREVLRNANK